MSFNGQRVAIIPARGGSQRIRSKNLRTINNIPLIVKAVDSCLKSKIFDKVIVSTNSFEIESSIVQFDVHIHKRSLKNSRNLSSTEDVIEEIFNFYSNSIADDSLIYLVQCTSPFLKKDDLRNSLNFYKNSNLVNSVFSGYEFNKFIWKDKNKTKIVSPINYIPEKRPRTQDKTPLIVENGAFYIFGKYNFDVTGCRLHGNVGSFLMNELRSIDIDEEEDLKFANFLSNFIEK